MPTKIEWTDESWNPITGCTPVSEGCANCYAANMAKRFWGDRKFSDVQFHENRLEVPTKWKKARRIFTVTMGDLFHPSISHIQRNMVFEAMALSSHHTFQLLTKRLEIAIGYDKWREESWLGYPYTPWQNNIWLGVTCENQKTADERMGFLSDIPAAVRFVSCEPLLSNINLFHRNMLDWVICGTESGAKRRPAKIEWIRNLRDQCVDFNIPFFLKQMEIDGKVVKMPELDGKIWPEIPK